MPNGGGGAGLGFQPFFDAVVRSGDRTRGVIYVLAVTTLFVVVGTLSLVIDWNERRVGHWTPYIYCFDKERIASAACEKLNDLGGTDFRLIGAPIEQLNELKGLKAQGKEKEQEAEALTVRLLQSSDLSTARSLFNSRLEELNREDLKDDALTIPIFGIAIDTNDFWIVSGVLVSVIYLILLTHLQSERATLEVAWRHCRNADERDLLLTAQVYGQRPLQMPRNEYVRFLLRAFFFVIPPASNLWVLKTDVIDSWTFASNLLGTWYYIAVLVIETLFAILAVGLAALCFRANGENDRLLGEFAETKFPRPTEV